MAGRCKQKKKQDMITLKTEFPHIEGHAVRNLAFALRTFEGNNLVCTHSTHIWVDKEYESGAYYGMIKMHITSQGKKDIYPKVCIKGDIPIYVSDLGQMRYQGEFKPGLEVRLDITLIQYNDEPTSLTGKVSPEVFYRVLNIYKEAIVRGHLMEVL